MLKNMERSNSMDTEQIVTKYYDNWDEESRVLRDNAHLTEFYITMEYIKKYAPKNSKIIEIGCGAGVYSLELAEQGYDVTAVDISEKNLRTLRGKVNPKSKIRVLNRNACNLFDIENDTFDVCLCLGPLYHLFDEEDIDRAINETKRVTKKNGTIFFAFLSQDYIMMRVPQKIFSNPLRYLTEDYKFISNIDEAFYYFSIKGFKILMEKYNMRKECLFSMDGITSFIRDDINQLDDEAYGHYLSYLKKNCEREEIVGFSPHLCYVTYNQK